MIELEKMSKPRKSYFARKVVMGILLVSVLLLAGLHSAGYAVLIADDGTTGEIRPGMTQLSCAYFTGTERVINRVTRATTDATRPPRCPFVAKIPRRYSSF